MGLREELRGPLVKALERVNMIDWPRCGGVAHESIKAELYVAGIARGYIPLPEYRLWPRRQNKVDMVWLTKDKKYAGAFEIDKAVSLGSLKKLAWFKDRCPRFIISIGRSHSMSAVRKALIEAAGVEHIDLTSILKRRKQTEYEKKMRNS